MIYLDSAALVKLCRHEEHTPEVVAWLDERTGENLIGSALVEVEVPRALRRFAPQALPAVPATLARIYRIEIDTTIRATAAAYEEPALRSLDAIHLATAQVYAEMTASAVTFVTYDRRLRQAAADQAMGVASPGVR